MDIEHRDDIDLLIQEFYALVMVDDHISFLFTDVARIHLPTHLPKIADFWEKILLGSGPYAGNPMKPHMDLHARSPLLPAHFERWLELFEQTVDRLFSGPKADEAKARANHVAALMEYKTRGGR